MTNNTKDITTHDPESMEARYQRAANIMQGICTTKLVRNATLFPVWIAESNCFWYEKQQKDGKQYRLVNADAAQNTVAFDHNAFATALAESIKQEVDERDLPVNDVTITLNAATSAERVVKSVDFNAFGKHWTFDLQSAKCTEIDTMPEGWVVSPNGEQAIFVRDFNLWVYDLKKEEETALTQDGEKYYVYGAVGTAWGSPPGPGKLQAQWSPDGKSVFTVQRDTRQVQTLPVVHHVPKDGSLRPTVEHVKVSYAGDNQIETLRIVVIEAETGRTLEANSRQIPTTRNGWGFFDAGLGWWGTDSRCIYFVDMERDYKTVRVVAFDTHSGITKILFEETSDTQINLMPNGDQYPTFMPLPETNELLWYSERSGWGHLYLYDLETGQLKNAITQGKWLVRDVVHYDSKRREIFVQTAGRVLDRDPYYRDLVRIQIDTGEINTLVSSNHEYVAIAQKNILTIMAAFFNPSALSSCSVSENGNFAVVTRSRADEIPVSLLLDREGRELLEIEVADISGLPDNWRWPEPVKLLAADGETEIYGLVYCPSDFSPDKSYPVVSHANHSPDMSRVGKGSFSNGVLFDWQYLEAAALAELGFIVVQIDGRGTPGRHKAFQDHSYGRSLYASDPDDHVTAIRQLIKIYPNIDLTRVGIFAPGSAGHGSIIGLLQYPDFYKVGVCGNPHDHRLMSTSMVTDKYDGVFTFSETSSAISSNVNPLLEDLVDNLRGKLLLVHGMLDFCTPPAATFRIVDALQKANKDFDMLLLPNVAHNRHNYLIRRSWDYLVRHLLGVEPPSEFKLSTVFDEDLDLGQEE